MENKNIIIILVAIIVVLAAIIGFTVLNPMHAKEPTKIKITSNKTLYEGDDLSVKLTDLNKTPLSKEKVNITIKNSKGKVVVNKTVKTNDKGKAKLDLDLKEGKYTVNVTYGENENYSGSNTTQKLTIKEKVIEAVSESNEAASSNYAQSSKPPRTEYTGDPNDMEAYTQWRKQDLQSENPHRGYSVLLDGPEKSPVMWYLPWK